MIEERKRKLLLGLMAVVGLAGLAYLYGHNPAEVSGFPKCPFFALTGYKCPGCGTLRGLHFLLHGQFAKAWGMNPLMIVSIPLIGLLLFTRIGRSVTVSRGILVVVLGYWLLRNLWD